MQQDGQYVLQECGLEVKDVLLSAWHPPWVSWFQPLLRAGGDYVLHEPNEQTSEENI